MIESSGPTGRDVDDTNDVRLVQDRTETEEGSTGKTWSQVRTR